MEENIENLDSPNEELETDDSTNVEEEKSEEVDVEALKVENAKLKKTNQELYEKEKKARGLVRNAEGQWVKKEPIAKVEEKTETKSDEEKLTSEEVLVFVGAGITNREDIDEAISFARYKKIPLEEALKNSILKNTLKEKAEERKTAEATNTKPGGKATSKVTGETLIAKALESNQLPESDDAIHAMVESKWGK